MAIDQQSDFDSVKQYLIDQPTPRWDVPAMISLRTLLAEAVPDHNKARDIAQQTAIDLHEWHQNQAIGPAWGDLIDIAMRQGKFRDLLQKVISHKSISAFKPRFEEYLSLENPKPTNNAAISTYPTPSPGAVQPATTPATAVPPAAATNTTVPPNQSATPSPPPVQPAAPPTAPLESASEATSKSSWRWLFALLLVLALGAMVVVEWSRFQTASQIKPNPSLSIHDEAGIIKEVLRFEKTYAALDRRKIPAGKTKLCLNIDEAGGGRLRFEWNSRPPGRILGPRNDKCCELNLIEEQGPIDVDVTIEIEHTTMLPWLKPRVHSTMRTLSMLPLSPKFFPRMTP